MKLTKVLIVIIIVSLFLTSCGSTSQLNNAEQPIVIWAYDSSAESALKAVEVYKESHPDSNVDFEVITLGQEDMVEKLKIGLETGALGSLPDIFYDEDYNFMEYIHYYKDSFADLTKYINSEEYLDFKIMNVTYDDKIYALPYDCGVGTLFYRLDLIEAAGYSEEDMESLTWSEYIEIGKKVKEATGINMTTIVPEGDMEGRLMYQSGGTWFFDEDGNANIENNQVFTDALLTMKNMFDADIVHRATSWDDIISAISNEQIASLTGGSWWAPIISSYEEQKGLWRVTQMPRMEGSSEYSNSSNLGGGNWFVINNENKETSINFVVETFGNSLELANYIATEYSMISVNKLVSAEISSVENDFYGDQNISAMMREWSQDIPPVLYGLHTYEITYTVGEYVDSYVNNEISLEEALEKMQQAAEKVAEN